MKVLLTGATGFLGKYVLADLQSHGTKVVVVGRTIPDSFKGHFICADLLNSTTIDEVAKEANATHLLHLAWYAEHGKYWDSPLNLRWVDSTVRLVEAFCKYGGKRVVAAGTCAEYDWSYGYCQEDITPTNPATLYGICKDTTRRMVESICESNQVTFAWGRIFFPFGAGEDDRRLISSLFEVFRGHKKAFGVNAVTYRDFLHITDVASAFLLLLQGSIIGTFNISSGEPTKIEDIVKMIAERCNADPNIILSLVAEQRKDDPRILLGDNRKLMSIGWNMRHPFRNMLYEL